tara:strand:+ start:17146 stop:17877 length:732 start_codon:yes stop_codon:yes gene_type:complete
MQTKSIEKYFDNISSEYTKNFIVKKSSKNYIFRTRKKTVLSFLYKKKGSILDIATGSGEISSEILKRNQFDKITLVDISKNMLNMTKEKVKKIKKVKKVEYINKNFAKIKNKNKYNYIVCLGILAHFINSKLFFLKLSKLSKKGTIVILQSSLLNFPINKLNKFLFSNRYKKKFNYKINFISEKKLNFFFKKHGFKILVIKKYSVGLPVIDKFFPKLNYYIDLSFDKLFPSSGSEAIFILKKI